MEAMIGAMPCASSWIPPVFHASTIGARFTVRFWMGPIRTITKKNANKLCLAPGDGGCIQTAFAPTSGFDIVPPRPIGVNTATLDTAPTEAFGEEGNLVQTKNFAVPYMPVPYPVPTPVDPDGTGGPYNFFASPENDAISIYFPIYIGGERNIRRTGGRPMIYIDYYDIDREQLGVAGPLARASAAECAAANTSNAQALTVTDSYCLVGDSRGHQIMHVRADQNFHIMRAGNRIDWEYAGLRIIFNIPGRDDFCYDGDGAGLPDPNCPGGGETVGNGIDDVDEPGYAGPGTAGAFVNYNAMMAGNDLYYLTKLGRLELLGVPQIWYEPIYCNSNRHRLVEGIFDLSPSNRNAFSGAGNYPAFGFPHNGAVNGRDFHDLYDSAAYNDISNTSGHVTFQDKVNLPKVFSGHKFMCCLGLGEETSDSSRCCSGYAQEGEEGGKLACMLPEGANLNVYFNRFVSNDGRGDERPGGGLVDDDFIPETGEPRNKQTVYDKLTALGEAYCQNFEVRRGSAFGRYHAQPNDGFYLQLNTAQEGQRFYSIVDDPADWDGDAENGYFEFLRGFRWNHHIYCK